MIRIPSDLLTVLSLAIIIGSQSSSAQCVRYSVEIFAGPACQILPSWAGAWGISDTGAICGGYVDCGENGHHVIWWPNGGVTEMPPSADGGIPDWPLDINSAGQVAGQMYVPNLQPTPYRAFLYSNGVTINLGALPGHNDSVAGAINASGIVVGKSINNIVGPLTAFVWQDGNMSALPLPYNFGSVATDISDTGLICGRMDTGPFKPPTEPANPFIYDLATGEVIDVGTPLPGTNYAAATGINNAGTICGFSAFPCGELCFTVKGFIWSKGVVQELGAGSFTKPYAINDSNVIVGVSDVVGLFVWQNGIMQALNDLVPPELNLNIYDVGDINNAGQVVAQASRPGPNGWDQVAVRLTPIPPLTGDITCDWKVNVPDLLAVISAWGPCPPAPPQEPFTETCHADFNDDGVVNHHDIVAVVLNWTL